MILKNAINTRAHLGTGTRVLASFDTGYVFFGITIPEFLVYHRPAPRNVYEYYCFPEPPEYAKIEAIL